MLETTIQLGFNILVPAAIYALLAAGFTVVYSVTRVLDLSIGALAIAAGYIFWAATIRGGLPIVVGVVLAVGFAIVLELTIATLVYEPLRRRRILSTAISLIASLSVLHIIQNGLLATFGPLIQSFSKLEARSFSVLGAGTTSIEFAALIIPIVLLAALGFLLYRSKIGKALRATADHEEVAEIIGIDVRKIRYWGYLIAGIAAGAAGILFALQYNLEPNMSILTSVRMFVRAILGGIGSVPGAILGSIITEAILNLTTFFWRTEMQEVIYFVVIFLVLLWRPQGLFGKKSS